METRNPFRETITSMNDGHVEGEAPITLRPPRTLKQDAAAILRARGWDMRGYFVACLAALTTDPDTELAAKTPHRQPEKPRGRPRNTGRRTA
jgi:hypothetical protein